MTVIANSTRKQRRVALAKMLFQLTVGFGVSLGANSLMAQHCDQCQSRSISEPSCGCETGSCTSKVKKTCIPKPSFAEKIFSHLDKVGDRIESKWTKSTKIGCASRTPNCGCEVAPSCGSEVAPSCGCEVAPTCGCEVAPTCGCEVSPSCGFEPNSIQSTQPQLNSVIGRAAPPKTNVESGAPAAKGSIGDSKDSKTAVTEKNRSSQTAEEKVRTIPKFTSQTQAEDRTSSRAGRTNPGLSGSKLGGDLPQESVDEQNSIPSLAPTILPPAARPLPIPKEQALPDVLVDPFKDDASVRKTRDKMEGVLLTNGQRRKASPAVEGRKQYDNPSDAAPPSLTKGQRNGSQIEFDAIVPSDKNESSVIPTSFRTVSAEVIVAKKKSPAIPSDESEGTPTVARLPVPRAR